MTNVLLATLLSIVCAVPQQQQRSTPPPAQKPAGPTKPATPPANPPANKSAPKSGTPAPQASTPPAPTPAPPTPAPPTPAPASPAPREYIVGAEDVLQITVIGEADMSRQYRVASNGKIEFPQVGQVQAKGLSAVGLEQALVKALSEFIRQPQVSVEVAEYHSQKVYVQGDVRQTGPYILEGPTSLLDILSRAGWNPATGSDQIQIITPKVAINGPVLTTAGTNATVQTISVAELQSGKLLSVQIRDGDTIYVPKAATFFIQGEVRAPGEFTLTPGMTFQQAIIRAGGMTERGTDGRMKALRTVNGKPQEVPVKLTDKVLPNDTITVAKRWF